MAGDDKDIALSLPDPPPPAPGRREAAIDAALRRFDGAGEPLVARPAASPRGWWMGRPQAGMLVAAALVALIGAPVAWMEASRPTAPAARETLASAADTSVPLPSAPPAVQPRASLAAEPAPAAASPMLADTREAKAAAPSAEAPAGAAPASATPGTAQRLPADRIELADAAMPSSRVATRSAPPEIMAMAPPVITPTAPPAPPPPPPPPAAVAAPAEAAESDASAVVVTAQRVSARKAAARGDWNACTVDDPARSLGRCRKLVDPRAAADLADGLTRAWQGDTDGAIAAFDRAIAAAPKLAFAYLNRGLAYRQRGDLDRALADLDQAVRYAPGAARGYHNRALLHRARRDAARADADEDRAVALDPRYAAVVR